MLMVIPDSPKLMAGKVISITSKRAGILVIDNDDGFITSPSILVWDDVFLALVRIRSEL
jgi:hypothetical protein